MLKANSNMFLAFCLLHVFALLNAQQNRPQDLPRHLQEVGCPNIKTYLPQDYNGTGQIWDAVEDSKGIFYFANGRNILIYDGVIWQTINTPNLGAVKSLAIGENDIVFVGGTKDFGYLEANSIGQLEYRSLVHLIEDESIEFDNIWQIEYTSNGVFFNAEKILFRWYNNELDYWKTADNPITKMGLANGKLFFFQKEKGLMHIRNENITLLPGSEDLSNYYISAILPFEENKLLLGTSHNGLLSYQNGKIEPFKTELDEFLIENKLYTGEYLSNKSIVLGTRYAGIVIIDRQGRVRHKIEKPLIPSNFVLNFFKGSDDVLWATTQNGIARIEYPSPNTYFSKSLGINENVNEIIRYNHTLFVGTGDGLFYLSNGQNANQSFVRFQGIEEKVWDLEIFEDVLLIALENGVYQIKDDKLILISSKIPSSFYRSKIDKNRVYIPYKEGLFSIYYDAGDWVEEKPIKDLSGANYAVTEDTNGNLFVNAYHTSLTHILFSSIEDAINQKVSEVKIIDQKMGFPDDFGDLFSKNEKIFFVAWTTKQTYAFNSTSNSFALDTTLNKMLGFDKSINFDHTNVKDDIWFRIYNAKNEPKHFVGYKMASKKYEVKELEEVRSKNWVGSVKFVEDSIVWYHWLKPRITRHDLRIEQKPRRKIYSVVRNVTFNGDSLLYAGHTNNSPILLNFKLPYQKNRFRFGYALPYLFHETDNEYQVNLEGYDKNWSVWSTETQKDYTNIPEGDYTFKVRAKNIFGKISKEDSYSFSILPPWYRTWWAYALYSLGAILNLMLFSQWRSNQLKAKNLALEKVVDERTQEIKTKNLQLENQTEKLKELDTMKTRLFANISHEFRTPLTLIKGPVEKMEEAGETKLSMTNVKMIRRNANRLLKLVNQLLDLSKLDSGKLRLNAAEGDLFKCLRAAASSFSSHAAQRDIDYQISIPSQPLWANFDRDKVEKITYNLLSNAFKFTQDKGKIKIKVSYRGEQLQLVVSDSGQGIKKDKLPHIFDRFFQVDDSYTREKAGSGIGLALTKELVDLMEGEIYVESEFGKGSVFKIVIELEEIKSHKKQAFEEYEIVPHEESETIDTPAKTENKEYQILIIEDNNDMRHFIKEQLQDEYEVLEAFNGKEGLKKANKIVPDLIITDLMMPQMDGITLCKELKVGIHTSHIPVVMLTAKAGIENKLEGLETGADDYLTKPFNARELQVRVKNLINERQKLRELFTQKPDINPKEITVTSLDEKFLNQVLELLEEKHIESEFGVPQMQDALGMSKTQLHRKLKALTDHPPGELLRNFRLKRAAQLLLQKGENVSQIAYAVGFNGLSYFTKCFKELYGVAPSDYTEKGGSNS